MLSSALLSLRRLALVLAALTPCAAAAELVPFVMPWDDVAPGPTDLRPVLGQSAAAAQQVTVQDGHLSAGGRRLRLFGVNLTAGANYPDHATAERVAARMAKFGLNAVRFHFLDADWGVPALMDYTTGDWKNWSAEAQDRLDYFFAQLKARGLYANINLLVGRKFGARDGVNEAITKMDWKSAHAVGFFHAPHLAAQKEYARRLLSHRNPYTKQTYAADPAVAIVEINNENGLIHTWMGGDFDTLPEPFAGDLQRQWNAWLTARHGTTAALMTAWKAKHEPPGAEMLKNGRFTDGTNGWTMEQHEGAQALATAEDGAVTLKVDRAGSEAWHVQWHQGGMRVVKGGIYTMKFRAAADRVRTVSVDLMQAHAPWQPLGWHAELTLHPEWREYSFTFTAGESDDNARIGFGGLNAAGARFRFGDVSCKPGGRTALEEGELLERKNIRTPRALGGPPLLPDARLEWITFLWETEDRYWREMRRFLKMELGVQALLTGTIGGTSSPNLMAHFDVMDTHAYWQHPVFPGGSWDMEHWSVRNVPMTDHPAEATLPRLAMMRIQGKPHMVSEYNHPAPNHHAAEGPLLLAAYGALQDWDALFLYTYAHAVENMKEGKIPGFFDVSQHPAVMATAAAGALIFRRGDVESARDVLAIPLPPAQERELIARHGQAWSVVPAEKLGLDLMSTLQHRVALDLSDKAPPLRARESKAPWITATGELTWRMDGPRGVVEIRTPRTKAATGRLDGAALDLGHGVKIQAGTTAAQWCAISLSVLEGESFPAGARRALLTAAGMAENRGFAWKDAEKTSIRSDWGRSPSVIECVPATVTIPSYNRRPLVHALDERGQRRTPPLPVQISGGSASFTIGPPQATLWYEIEWPADR